MRSTGLAGIPWDLAFPPWQGGLTRWPKIQRTEHLHRLHRLESCGSDGRREVLADGTLVAGEDARFVESLVTPSRGRNMRRLG